MIKNRPTASIAAAGQAHSLAAKLKLPGIIALNDATECGEGKGFVRTTCFFLSLLAFNAQRSYKRRGGEERNVCII
jgi:hypothetical protein